MNRHNIPRALTFALTTRAVGARWVRAVLVGESVSPRGRDQDNPLLVRHNDPERQDLSPLLRSAPRVRATPNPGWELVTTNQIAAPDRHYEGNPICVRDGTAGRRLQTALRHAPEHRRRLTSRLAHPVSARLSVIRSPMVSRSIAVGCSGVAMTMRRSWKQPANVRLRETKMPGVVRLDHNTGCHDDTVRPSGLP